MQPHSNVQRITTQRDTPDFAPLPGGDGTVDFDVAGMQAKPRQRGQPRVEDLCVLGWADDRQNAGDVDEPTAGSGPAGPIRRGRSSELGDESGSGVVRSDPDPLSSGRRRAADVPILPASPGVGGFGIRRAQERHDGGHGAAGLGPQCLLPPAAPAAAA
jgi:hypothetical protein